MIYVLLIVIAAMAYLLFRQLRAVRHRWLSRLSLPGAWDCEGEGGIVHLDIKGDLHKGVYEERWLENGQPKKERGEWSIRGNEIWFEPESGNISRCDLRLFGDGSMGVHGPRREHRVYVRRQSNVVPLRGHR